MVLNWKNKKSKCWWQSGLLPQVTPKGGTLQGAEVGPRVKQTLKYIVSFLFLAQHIPMNELLICNALNLKQHLKTKLQVIFRVAVGYISQKIEIWPRVSTPRKSNSSTTLFLITFIINRCVFYLIHMLILAELLQSGPLFATKNYMKKMLGHVRFGPYFYVILNMQKNLQINGPQLFFTYIVYYYLFDECVLDMLG